MKFSRLATAKEAIADIMLAPDRRWSIFEDLANQHCPDDIRRGRAQIRDELAVCEAWIERWTTRLNRIRRIAIAVVATSIAVMVANAFGLWPSGPWLTVAAGSVLVWGICVAAPVWLQMPFLGWSKRFPLSDERLDALKAYLSAAAASTEPLHAHDGNAVASDFLMNPWAVLLFSEREEIRQLPTFGSKGLRRVRYAKWLTTDRPFANELPQVMGTAAPPVTILLDRSVTNIDRRTQHLTVEQRSTTIQTNNHFQFITQISAQADAMARRAPEDGRTEHDASPAKVRWPCTFEDADFLIRLQIFETTALCEAKQRVEPHQIKKYVIAVLTARRLWLANPTKDIASVAEEIGELVKSNTDGWAGLRKSDSIDWIKPVISGTGNYAFVKEVFSAISYDTAEYDNAQYRLLL
ncbi:hypothetical protein GCM10007973_24360 [Polymorphobacter multimanifer]|uniref:hypothetical protein n=1 Tax=Polymorphobacter multimanifer TaxID=1070431 RepID=UPI00166F522F|nr:hypothetical protein [Polymorphobacter multimanifer]GGI87049.1 hypothetical protein GCM10007973_24360 [Polymorphobacter multimanifer]